MKVRLVPRAQADMDRAIGWWRENALRPLMLEAALRAAFKRLAAGQLTGAPAKSHRVPEARRLLLPTQHLVFFVVDEPNDEVIVLRVWHTSRRRPPMLQGGRSDASSAYESSDTLSGTRQWPAGSPPDYVFGAV